MKVITIAIILFWYIGLNAQNDFKRVEFSFPATPCILPSPSPSPQPLLSPFLNSTYSNFSQTSTRLFIQSIDHLPGFFCKMEYRIEVKSKLSPRFRLGSVNYTNWMEGKGEWYSRYWK